jgi:hypothetical protein
MITFQSQNPHQGIWMIDRQYLDVFGVWFRVIQLQYITQYFSAYTNNFLHEMENITRIFFDVLFFIWEFIFFPFVFKFHQELNFPHWWQLNVIDGLFRCMEKHYDLYEMKRFYHISIIRYIFLIFPYQKMTWNLQYFNIICTHFFSIHFQTWFIEIDSIPIKKVSCHFEWKNFLVSYRIRNSILYKKFKIRFPL